MPEGQLAGRPTPEQMQGPFYPVAKPDDRDADLTRVKGKPGRAQGQVVYVTGRILDLDGSPVSGARVEIWQANAFGRYTHPSDTNLAPIDPNFQGYGVQTTDGGVYRFKTVKPGSYPAGTGWTRPPHIHFIVTGASSQLTTQMYFDGEPLNASDLLLKDTPDKERLIVKLTPPPADAEPGSLIAQFDIVLPQGKLKFK